MTCVHLKKLFQLCDSYDLKMSSSDLIRITCPQCGQQETCPAGLYEDAAEESTDQSDLAASESE